MAFDPISTLREWKHKVASLQERWRGARLEIEQLRQENEKLRRREQQLEQREKQLEREQERLRQENERLKRQLEQAQRARKRQAAPFSRGNVSERAIRALIGARKNWGRQPHPPGSSRSGRAHQYSANRQTAGHETLRCFAGITGFQRPAQDSRSVPAPETPLDPVHSSLHLPPRFAVPVILAPPPSPGLAAAPV